MKANRKTVIGSDTGASDLQTDKRTTSTIIEPKSAGLGTASSTRHRVTFMDEVTSDKKQLTEIHYIESYKKYN